MNKRELQRRAGILAEQWPKPGELPNRYPELETIADELADDVARNINARVREVDSEMPYKAQYVLEVLIRLLEERV